MIEDNLHQPLASIHICAHMHVYSHDNMHIPHTILNIYRKEFMSKIRAKMDNTTIKALSLADPNTVHHLMEMTWCHRQWAESSEPHFLGPRSLLCRTEYFIEHCSGLCNSPLWRSKPFPPPAQFPQPHAHSICGPCRLDSSAPASPTGNSGWCCSESCKGQWPALHRDINPGLPPCSVLLVYVALIWGEPAGTSPHLSLGPTRSQYFLTNIPRAGIPRPMSPSHWETYRLLPDRKCAQ